MRHVHGLIALAGLGAIGACSSAGQDADTVFTSADGTGVDATVGPTSDATSISTSGQPTSTTMDTSADGAKFDLADPGDFTGADDTGGQVDRSTCESAAASLTSAGCLFAPIIGNPSSETFMGPLPWAVIAANTNVMVANVDFFDHQGDLIESAVIDPGDLYVFEIDGADPLMLQAEMQDQTETNSQVLRLESDIPVVAYQFQPYSTSQVATADAALLLPDHAWGDNYLVVDAQNDGDKWLTVVSLVADNEVTVDMPASVVGTTQAGGGIPSLGAGQGHSVTLGPQQALRILAASAGADLTGVRVTSTKPVAVFAGSSGMSLPGPGFMSWRDYLEEQLPPRTAWGTEYAVVKFRPRNAEADLYRIIADKDGTVVNVEGGYVDTFMLDEGEFVQFETAENFVATANEAFLVVHLMESAVNSGTGPKDENLYPGPYISPNCAGSTSVSDLADPAMTFIPPVDQYRYRYTFLTPFTYAWDMVTVVARESDWDTIELDGSPLPAAQSLGVDDFVYARFLVEDGPHLIESQVAKFGLEVYGYDCRISYAYPGGLSLGTINTPPPPAG